MKEINGVIREDGDIVWCTVDGVLTRNEYRDGKWYRITPTVVG